MGPLLFPLPVLAIVLAALDALLARWARPWRSVEVDLFFHAYFLWALFGILALLPARQTLRFLDARSAPWPSRGYDARPWIVMLGWMVLPVMGQATLDEHTSLVGFAGLLDPRPWLELGGTVLGSALGLALLGRWLGGVSGVVSGGASVAREARPGEAPPGAVRRWPRPRRTRASARPSPATGRGSRARSALPETDRGA